MFVSQMTVEGAPLPSLACSGTSNEQETNIRGAKSLGLGVCLLL